MPLTGAATTAAAAASRFPVRQCPISRGGYAHPLGLELGLGLRLSIESDVGGRGKNWK